MSWKTTGELLADIHETLRGLRAGETTVDEAHAAARTLAVAQRVIMVQLEYARLSGLIEQGSDMLPDVWLGGGEEAGVPDSEEDGVPDSEDGW